MGTYRCPTASTKTLGDEAKTGDRRRPSESCVGLRTTGNGCAGYEALVEIVYDLALSWSGLSHGGDPPETWARTVVRRA